MPTTPDLRDIYRLAEQLEKDRELSMDALRSRDHQLAANCPNDDDAAQLLCWLNGVAAPRDSAPRTGALLPLSGLTAGLLGFMAMAGFLLSSGRGLVNVLVLLSVFVLLQCAMSALSAFVLLRMARGSVAPVLPSSPARWLALRSLPDARDLREVSSAVRLLALRYGQAWGLLFTLGALLAFVIVPALADFSFVWGSTFPVSTGLMQSATAGLAAPWSTLAPWATVTPDVIASSRFHPAIYSIDQAGIERMRGWWGFLFLSLTVYALLPRLLLWIGATLYYPRLVRRSFLAYPGARLVLQRMRRPLVSTQAAHGSTQAQAAGDTAPTAASVPLDGHLLLLDWSAALGDESPANFEELLAVDPRNLLRVGGGSFRAEREKLEQQATTGFDHLLVVVKSWEPPMAELADLLAVLANIEHCSIYLLPLAGKAVPHRKVEDWRSFARPLPFRRVDVGLLNRVVTP
ncbi:MAG: DUF2868 domain-containing protein [Halioglobus sp.]|nr:DUF2868 domain-containing protein [Halioglobus sp.]